MTRAYSMFLQAFDKTVMFCLKKQDVNKISGFSIKYVDIREGVKYYFFIYGFTDFTKIRHYPNQYPIWVIRKHTANAITRGMRLETTVHLTLRVSFQIVSVVVLHG